MEKKNMLHSLPDTLRGLFQKKNWLFWAGLAGIVLIFLSDILFGAPKGGAVGKEEASESAVAAVQQLERKLEAMLENVEGAGRARVMITLEGTGETVYAQNEQSDTQTRQTGEGVTERSESYQNEHIIIDAAGKDQPLIEARLEPEVKGVAVVCEGGGDIAVIKRITDLVSVVLGVSTNRICVAKMI